MPPLNVNIQELIEQIDVDLADGDELAKVSEARQRASTLAGIGDQVIDHFVTRARAAGASWSQIGGALGVSKQAAQQRWTPSAFSRFTERARHAVVLAQERARQLQHAVIEPEHVILGLAEVEQGAASQVLASITGSVETIRQQITEGMTPGSEPAPAHIPFAPECKEAMKLSFDEALDLGHNYIGTEHLLLGLLKVPDGQGARLLAELGVSYDLARERVLQWIADYLVAHPEVARHWQSGPATA